MPAFSFYDFGVVQASRGSLLWIPAGYRKDGSKRGVVYVHGAGETATALLNPGNVGKTAEAVLLQQVASVYPMISADLGVQGAGNTTDLNSWGNTNAQTELGNAITRLQAAGGGGAKTDKVILLGISMGHALSMNYAQANPSKVIAIGGILPVNDLDDIRDNDRGSNRAGISTAWGTAAWTAPGTPALPAAANPSKPANQTNLTAIPQRLWYASDDTICTAATVTTMVGNLPIITTYNLGAFGHTDAAVGKVPVADMMAWLAAYA